MKNVLARVLKRGGGTLKCRPHDVPVSPKTGEIWAPAGGDGAEAPCEIREVTNYSVTLFEPGRGARTRSKSWFLRNYRLIKPAAPTPVEILAWLETNAKKIEWTDTQVILDYWLQKPGATWAGIDSRRVEAGTLAGCVEQARKSSP